MWCCAAVGQERRGKAAKGGRMRVGVARSTRAVVDLALWIDGCASESDDDRSLSHMERRPGVLLECVASMQSVGPDTYPEELMSATVNRQPVKFFLEGLTINGK